VESRGFHEETRGHKLEVTYPMPDQRPDMTFRGVITCLFMCMALSAMTLEVRGECGNTTLERDIRNAEVIFAGTVRSVRVTPTTTHYVFEDLKYAKGSGQPDSLLVRQMGGSQMVFSPNVAFQSGSRYIVFAGRWPDGELAATACGEGPFLVRKSIETGLPFVADGGGRAFLAYDSLRVVTLMPKPWTTDLAPRQFGPPPPPSRRALPDILSDLDSIGSFTGEPRPYSPSRPRVPGEGVRSAYLYLHQDTGDRVIEDEMLRLLTAIDQRTSRSTPTLK